MNRDENPPTPKLKAEDLFTPGTIAERVELQLGVLTQGVVDCMVLASGAFPSLTEGEPAQPNAFRAAKPSALSSWQAARSAELRDAARLSEASARLLAGFARLRGQFSQDFTIRHNEKRKAGGAGNRLRNTTITHSFSVPAREAASVASVEPKRAADLTRNLAKGAEGFAPDAAAKPEDKKEETIADLYRSLGFEPDPDDEEPEDGEAPSGANPPPPPPGA